MKLNPKTIASAMVVAVCVWSQTDHSAHAAVIYDNLSFPSTFGDAVRSVTPTGGVSDGPLADSFSVGNYLFTLTNVKVNVELGTRTVVAGASTIVRLRRDNGTSPGALVAVLGTIADTQLTFRTPTVIDLPQATGINLAPLSRYWIELITSNDSRAEWAAAGGDGSGSTYGTAPNQFGIGGLGEYFYAGGALALGYPSQVFQNGASPYLPYEMQVSGNIPEPASLALLGLGLAGLGFLRHRIAQLVSNSDCPV